MVEGLDIVSMSVVLPHIKVLFHLSPQDVGLLAAASTFGITLGALPTGLLADRFGRRKTLLAGFLVCSCFTFLSGVAADYWMLVVCRFASGLGMAAIFAMPYGLVSEVVPSARRGMYVSIVETFLGLGYLLAPVFGLVCFGFIRQDYAWRVDLILSGLPALFFFFIRRNVIESPKWLISKDRLDEAEAIISRLEEWGSTTTPRSSLVEKVLPAAPRTAFLENRLSISKALRTVFSAPLIWQWIALGGGVFGVFAVFYVAIAFLPSVFLARGLSYTHSLWYALVATAFQVPGKICMSILGDRIGRKAAFGICIVLAALFLGLFCYFTDPISTMFFSTAFLFFIAGSGPLCKLWYAELFPTACRATGQNIVEGFFGRLLGGVVWVSVFPVLTHHFGQNQVLAYVAAMLVILSIPALLFTPETRKHSAPIESDVARESPESGDGLRSGVSGG